MAKKEETVIVVKSPNMQIIEFEIEGNAPYVQHRFSEKARKQMMETQEMGQCSRKGKKREPRDFDADYEASYYHSDGNCGIPVTQLKGSLIKACGLQGIVMTKAKCLLRVLEDFYDEKEPIPLVRLVGKPEKFITPARNSDSSMDLRSRALFRGWSAKVRIRYDADWFTATDIANLLMTAGLCGIGEGRPNSPKSTGMDWGTFQIKEGGENNGKDSDKKRQAKNR